ncbi:MAG: tRNA pseudouridine(55) synthase TruB [Desulfovibrionaceae bacterium]|nr:tRNA pseudouridine(55) synthase TruB [Desulfovibrionaceae bacterium]
MEQLNGLLVVNKPRGLSSAQCTNRLKRLGQRKIGHAGTLDPMAQGVLLVLLGQATKLSGYLMSGGTKTYKAVVEFGRSTDTWDDDGAVTSSLSGEDMRRLVLENAGFEAALRAELASWVGESEQAVPPYSAAKHEGRALYSLARAGKETPEKFKTVQISRAEVLWVDLPRAAFRVVCSSGTYIRSLAHSLGTRLSCGAVLTELIREYSHPFGLDSAVALDALLAEPELLYEKVIPLTAALPEWPQLRVSLQDERAVKNGTPLAAERFGGRDWAPDAKAVLLAADGAPLALAKAALCGSARVWTVLRGLWA